MQRPSRRGIHQFDIDAGDRVRIVKAHRKGLVTRRVSRRLEFEQSGHWRAVDQNLRLRTDAADDRTITRQGDGGGCELTGHGGAADDDVVAGAAMYDVIAEPGADGVIAPAEIDDVGDGRSSDREAGYGPITMEILRDHGLGRLSHHGIARAGVLVVEIALPEFDAFQPTAALRGPDLEKGVIGVRLRGGIGGAASGP